MALTKVQGEGITGITITANNQITKSTVPAFFVYNSTNDWFSNVSAGTLIQFNTAKFNLGSHFNLSTYKLIGTLTEISRKKQGDKKLTWDEWLEIPESNYLFQLDETMAKNIFDEGKKLKLLEINNNNLAVFDTGKDDGSSTNNK